MEQWQPATQTYSTRILYQLHELKWSLYKPDNVVWVLCTDCHVVNEQELKQQRYDAEQRILYYSQGKLRDTHLINNKRKYESSNITNDNDHIQAHESSTYTLFPQNNVRRIADEINESMPYNNNNSNTNTDSASDYYTKQAMSMDHDLNTTQSSSDLNITESSASPLFSLGFFKKHYNLPTGNSRPNIHGISCTVHGCKRAGRPYAATGTGGYGSLISHLRSHHKNQYDQYKHASANKPSRRTSKQVIIENKESDDKLNNYNINNQTQSMQQ